ncbi:MAG: flavodoxin family protein [Eubacterium sp.]|nr:flavodoxin family protein [Eubacterium sp.]
MKVLMLNGSRRPNGCTNEALKLVAASLQEEGIESEILFVGQDAINGKLKESLLNLKEKCGQADAFVFGAPVYYASPTGEIQIILDRLFGMAKEELRCKPAALVTSARRGGTTSTLDVLAKYPTINEMPVISANYWTMVHGSNPEDVMKDLEGVAVMKNLGKNMAWILKCIEAGKKAGIHKPEVMDKPQTNFV